MAAVLVLSSSVLVQETARDLCVVIDSRQSLSDHVATVCQSGYYQHLRRLSGARRKTPRRRWSRPLLSVAWTTVTPRVEKNVVNHDKKTFLGMVQPRGYTMVEPCG